MQFSAKQVADLLGGTLEGNDEVMVSSLSKIEEGKPGSISFLANPLYTQYIYDTQASLVIVNDNLELSAPVKHATLLRVPSAEKAFAKLLEMYNQVKLNKAAFLHSPLFPIRQAWERMHT
ncbi:MAG: LpxD N-terminal domain-containing protein [Chitinophagaceae bacterium]